MFIFLTIWLWKVVCVICKSSLVQILQRFAVKVTFLEYGVCSNDFWVILSRSNAFHSRDCVTRSVIFVYSASTHWLEWTTNWLEWTTPEKQEARLLTAIEQEGIIGKNANLTQFVWWAQRFYHYKNWRRQKKKQKQIDEKQLTCSQ